MNKNDRVCQGLYEDGMAYGEHEYSPDGVVWAATSENLMAKIEVGDEQSIAFYQGILATQPTDTPSDEQGFLYVYGR